MMEDLTQERLKELLDYDPATGDFIRKVARGNRKAGSVAGTSRPDGYRQIMVDGRTYLSHRLAFLFMEGSFPPAFVDHINHKEADNSLANLRHATNKENGRHTAMHVNNSSGINGVSWNKRLGKWMACIRVDGKQIYLGITHDKEEARRWRKAAEVKYGFSEFHGQPLEAFARLDKSAFAYTEEYA
jgi:hypothetical protein